MNPRRHHMLICGLCLLLWHDLPAVEQAGLGFDMRQQTFSIAVEKSEKLTPIIYRKMSDGRPLTVESLLVIGSSESSHTMYNLFRHKDQGKWMVSEISIMRDDGTDFWIIGKKQLKVPVTVEDLEAFMEETWWNRMDEDFALESSWVNTEWLARQGVERDRLKAVP